MNESSIFDMVDCPVAELHGMALDYVVAIVEGGHSLQTDGITWRITIDGLSRVLGQGLESIGYQPGRDWAQGGPIIELAQIGLHMNMPCSPGRMWEGCPSPLARGAGGKYGYGPTPLIAAMRCYVASKLGDSVEVPRGLIEW